jgi:hypothetical protein
MKLAGIPYAGCTPCEAPEIKTREISGYVPRNTQFRACLCANQRWSDWRMKIAA